MLPSRFQHAAPNSLSSRFHACRLRIQDGWQWRRQLAHLGSANHAEHASAAEWLLARHETARPRLHRALSAAPPVACGAAGILHQLGDLQGVRHILLRAYQDEWFTHYPAQDIAASAHHLEQRIGAEPIRQGIRQALEDAPYSPNAQACLQILTIALSGLRALNVIASHSEAPSNSKNDTSFWMQAFLFGTAQLPPYKQAITSMPLFGNMTGWMRAEAMRGLLREHPADICLTIFSDALRAEDQSVVRSAIIGLQCLGNPRAVPALETLAFTTGHPLSLPARRAIERLAGTQAEVLTLVRASKEDVEAEELLRAARPTRPEAAEGERETLLHV